MTASCIRIAALSGPVSWALSSAIAGSIVFGFIGFGIHPAIAIPADSGLLLEEALSGLVQAAELFVSSDSRVLIG